MKKWIVLIVALMMVAGVQTAGAKEKKGKGIASEMTKAKYIVAAQKRAEAAGTAFDQAKAEAQFAKLDKNGDGVLSKDEMPAGKGKAHKKSSAAE